jgi:hypothetical protein
MRPLVTSDMTLRARSNATAWMMPVSSSPVGEEMAASWEGVAS